MKYICLCFLLTFLFVSCSEHYSPVKGAADEEEPLSYCDLLDVHPRPAPSVSPKAYLGIYLSPKKMESSPLPCGDDYFVQVAGVIGGTPAEKAGLRDDDIILAVNGKPACGKMKGVVSSFRKTIERFGIGTSVTFDILRNDRRLTLSAALSGTPLHNQREASHPDIGRCSVSPSMIERALSSHGDLPVYYGVVSGLYERSNMVHNPGRSQEEESNPLQLSELTYMMRHPLASGEVAKELSDRIASPFLTGYPRLSEAVREAARLLDIDLPAVQKPYDATFPSLLEIMAETGKRVEAALAGLTPDERKLLRQKALSPWEDSQWKSVLDLSMKIPRKKLLDAFSPLLSFLAINNLSALKQDLIGRFGNNKGPILYETDTPMGKVIVGGFGPKIYTKDAALILDLGGDSVYLNNAGGTRPGIPVALVIDWGGNDRYISRENFSQGAGVLGGGFLIDLGGDDTFDTLDGGHGAGFWGIGLLYHGKGRAVYKARSFSQGTGQMGIGMIVDEAGDDQYTCSYAGQGLGLFGGAGIMIDMAGDDFYQLGGLKQDFRDPEKSTQSIGQGFGFGVRPGTKTEGAPGGIGMLIDKGGNDVYLADYFAQGASYYYGVGILDDDAGNDHYIAGRYAQGAGIHSSAGVLIDGGGDDFYYSSYGVAQGMGHDFGVGFLEDNGGDDIYWGGTLSQGAATNGSIGMLSDLGGNDHFMHAADGGAYADEESALGITISRVPGKDHRERKDSSVKIRIGAKKEQ